MTKEIRKTWLTIPETAQLLGISVRTLHRWMVAKKGPSYYRFGSGSIMFGLEDVTKFIDNSKVSNE